MRIHHLNCATMRPFGFILSDTATILSRANLVVHCLLIESDDGLVLVDSGYGLADRTHPGLFLDLFMRLSGAERSLAEAAASQVLNLGYALEDVRHIVQTHLHLDHAGGLPDFPHAQVHVYALEYQAAMRPKSFSERFYLPAHWAHQPDWVLHEPLGERWFGFEAMRVLEGVSPAIWLVPLPGHTRGHCAVAVQATSGWLLHCGDAYLSHSDIYPGTNPGSRPKWLQPLLRRMFPHVPRLQALLRKHGDEVDIFCAHDPSEFAWFQTN
ncbi:MAG TPA: MBL fold metallo-hydrolase [Anaerolineales bacterium]|nr:MBL fold metallo-hydrolase [Anaerolineales bacterium]